MTEETEGRRGGTGHPGASDVTGPPDARAWRSLLFVPGSRPERYPKAIASGADLVCVDLEDAVAPPDKPGARRQVMELMRSSQWVAARSVVRVNPAGTRPCADDVAALAELRAAWGPGTDLTVVLPKVEAPEEVDDVRRSLEEAGWHPTVIAMVETARGLEVAGDIAAAPGVVALFLGGVDLAADLGCALNWDALLYARSRLVHAAALAGGRAVLDVPDLDLHDVDGLEGRTRSVAELGFTGKSAIHPRQIRPIHRAMAPSNDEVDGARRLLDAYDRAGGGVISFEGTMVDRPVAEAARRLIWRASLTPTPTRQRRQRSIQASFTPSALVWKRCRIETFGAAAASRSKAR